MNLPFSPRNPDRPGAPATGQVLGGRYRLHEELARGGMGRVFAAFDMELKRRVAIKVIASPSPTDIALRRFRQEARALAAFNHPNILAIYDVGEDADFPYLVCELLEGATLRERSAAARFSLVEALEIAVQVAAGLAAAHDRQIIHRDLKPANVFITREGRVKLLDFGIAKLALAPALSETLSAEASAPSNAQAPGTAEGGVIGTAGYMAPEQIRGEPVDHRADVFSFGALLYEMVASRRAFARDSTRDTLDAVLTGQPTPLPKEVPASVRHIVDRCLEKDPERRFPSARDLLRELELARAALPDGRRRRRWLVACAAMLLTSSGTAIVAYRLAAGGPPGVLIMPIEADAAAAPLAAVIDPAFERALAQMPRVVRLSALAGTRRTVWTLRSSLAREGPKLRLSAQFETGGKKVGEPVEALGTAAELEKHADALAARVRDELMPLWRDHLRRERAHQLARSSTAEEKLGAYYDLMGPSPRLEFLARGHKLLDEALAADPAYVPALAERSLLLRLAAGLDGGDPSADLRLARASAEEALRIAPRDREALLAECLAVRLQMRAWPSDRELEAATSACSDAAQADPRSAEALYTLAQLYDQSCEDSKVVETLKLALDRAKRSDAGRAARVSLYLVSVALQRNHLQEADAFSSALLSQEAEEDRLEALTPGRRARVHPPAGTHVLRAAVLVRLRRYQEAEAQLEAELAGGAATVGGLDEAVEAASLRGLASLARRHRRQQDPVRAARLEALEKRFRSLDARSTSFSSLAGWYGFVDPDAAVAWLEQRKGQQGCGLSFQRAVIYRDAGHPDLAARALDSCHPSEQWARRCARVISAEIESSR
jgi:tetratricopeptide (TPR) repeat protein